MAAITSGVGMIIAAIIGAIGTGVTTSLNNQAIEDSNQEGLRLANIQRQDKLRLDADNKRLAQAQLRLQRREQKMRQETEMFGRKERAQERGYTMRQQRFANQINLLNRNDAMRDQLVNIWRRAA